MDAPKVEELNTSLEDLAAGKGTRGKLRDALVEVLEINDKTGVIKVKEVESDREFYAAPNERMHKDVSVIKTADFQGNMIDSRLKKTFPKGSKVILEGLIDYPDSGKDAEKPLQYRWLSSVPNDYTDEAGNVHKKVITGTIGALGYENDGEFKTINVFLFSKEAKKVEDLVELFDEQYKTLWAEHQKEKETGERGPVKPKYGFALVALNKENEVVACFPPVTNHAGSAFQDAVKAISPDEDVRNWYKYAPPSGEELKQIASAYEKELQGMGYGDDVHIEAVLVKSYVPSKNLKGGGARRLAEMRYPLFLDKNSNEPVMPRFGGGIAVVKEGILTLSPGKFNQRTGKLEGGENDFVNHLCASARREPWPSALGMKLSPEYSEALEMTKREWVEKMRASRDDNEVNAKNAKAEDAANKAEKVAEKSEKPGEIPEKALDSAGISEVAKVAAKMSDAPEM